MNNNNISFPVRLNRYLYLQGFCSRREADRLIEKGLVKVNGLDKASRGLMLFSNDGTIVDKLLNPKYEHEKEYVVTIDKRMTKDFFDTMERGVKIERYKTKPAKVTKIDSRSFKIILTEGKKHQIRRMCAALGYQVQDLKRTRIMNLRLGKIKPGSYKEVTGLELLTFLKSIGAIQKK